MHLWVWVLKGQQSQADLRCKAHCSATSDSQFKLWNSNLNPPSELGPYIYIAPGFFLATSSRFDKFMGVLEEERHLLACSLFLENFVHDCEVGNSETWIYAPLRDGQRSERWCSKDWTLLLAGTRQCFCRCGIQRSQGKWTGQVNFICKWNWAFLYNKVQQSETLIQQNTHFVACQHENHI